MESIQQLPLGAVSSVVAQCFPTVMPPGASLTFTRLTARQGQNLTKRIDLTDDGRLVKTAASAFGSGSFDTIPLPSILALPDFLRSLSTNQAIMAGVAATPSGRVTTKAKRLHGDLEAVSRSKDLFHFPSGPGLASIDYDAPESGALTRAELSQAILDVAPWLADTAVVWSVSSGSCIPAPRRSRAGRPRPRAAAQR